MLTAGINLNNFNTIGNKKKTRKEFYSLLRENNEIINSFKINYKDSYNKKKLNKFKNSSDFKLIGMGGSTLGAQTIYTFLKQKIKKKFHFIDNLNSNNKIIKKKTTNIIISKSGNTIETIVNSNIFIKKKDKNIFITENNKNYLYLLAEKLKGEIIHHNNFIGGRYSVLSEVGMLPAELMGLKASKFRQYNSLIKNKNFFNALIENVASSIALLSKKKFNSIIINYDKGSVNLFNWYQQLIGESLGKNGLGVLPVVSNMPKDNHSLMQLYLDGPKNNFFTIFYVHDSKSSKINNKKILSSHKYLNHKKLSDITYAQKVATEIVFKKRNIPFRSFEIKNRDEKTLGELFCFFMLEIMLIGRLLKINPFDQPAVELIKKETKNYLI